MFVVNVGTQFCYLRVLLTYSGASVHSSLNFLFLQVWYRQL